MPQTMTKSTCACSTSGTAPAKELIPGLVNADLSTIELTQGVPYSWRQCFVKSTKTVQILEERVGGQIVVSRAEHCYKVGDSIRLINYDPCSADTNDSVTVFPFASIVPNVGNPTQDVITLTGFTSIDKIYTAQAVASAMVPMGCAVGTVTTAESQPPYAIEVCDGSPILITGGITARDDYYQMFAVSGAAGSTIVYSTELGKVQPGDQIKSAALGFTNGVKVLRVDQEMVMDTGTGKKVTRDKITLAMPATLTSACAPIEVVRGMIARLNVMQSGACWELTIPGSATRNLQLNQKMKSGDSYNLGTLTITAFYGTLVNGKLVTRGVELMRSKVMLKPSHMGVN